MNHPLATRAAGSALPTLVTVCSEQARLRFLEFFAAGTRKAL
jgi:hypothetical protein